MVDLSFKVVREYRREFRLLAACLDGRMVDILKEAIALLVAAYKLDDKFPLLVEAGRVSSEKHREADHRGLGASEPDFESSPRDDVPDPMEPELGKRGKKKRSRKKRT